MIPLLTAALVVDGRTVQENTFTVTTVGEEFVTGLERDVVVADFPSAGESITLRWQQGVQGFALVPTETAQEWGCCRSRLVGAEAGWG